MNNIGKIISNYKYDIRRINEKFIKASQEKNYKVVNELRYDANILKIDFEKYLKNYLRTVDNSLAVIITSDYLDIDNNISFWDSTLIKYRDNFSYNSYFKSIIILIEKSPLMAVNPHFTLPSAALAGGVLGLVSGYRGGLVDLLVMRVIDAFQAFPSFMLALVLVFFLGPSLFNAMIAVGVASIPGYCRTMRGSVLSAKENEYVLAARAIGCSEWKIMLGHILPNVVAPLIVIATVGVAWAILTAAGLSFLGMGAQPPTPEWGQKPPSFFQMRRQTFIDSITVTEMANTGLGLKKYSLMD